MSSSLKEMLNQILIELFEIKKDIKLIKECLVQEDGYISNENVNSFNNRLNEHTCIETKMGCPYGPLCEKANRCLMGR